ncbi:MAG: integrase arm-type DNA-binding domain-containing protein, partial [Rhodospirillaceae bacterium]|nr:integrase arm-type DNA-binding domain-containing protein [Rhodospirillaceae bacterium]
MPQAYLTKSVVEAAKPKKNNYYVVWDSAENPRQHAIKNFGLKVLPSGRKVFIYIYRMDGRKSNHTRITIGPLSDSLTVLKARRRAEDLQAEVLAAKKGEGPDPRTKQKELAATRIRRKATAEDRELANVAESWLKKKEALKRSANYILDIRRTLEREVFQERKNAGFPGWR